MNLELTQDLIAFVPLPRAATASYTAPAAPVAPEWSSPPSSRTWACTTTSPESGVYVNSCAFDPALHFKAAFRKNATITYTFISTVCFYSEKRSLTKKSNLSPHNVNLFYMLLIKNMLFIPFGLFPGSGVTVGNPIDLKVTLFILHKNYLSKSTPQDLKELDATLIAVMKSFPSFRVVGILIHCPPSEVSSHL